MIVEQVNHDSTLHADFDMSIGGRYGLHDQLKICDLFEVVVVPVVV